jgi:hypothetical protein
MNSHNYIVKKAFVVTSIAMLAAQTVLADATLSLVKAGANTVSINLDNPVSVAGLQFSINASSNLVLEPLRKDGRTQNGSWQIYQYQPNDSTINVVILNTNPTNLPAGMGAIAQFALSGNNAGFASGSRLTFSRVVIADEFAQRVPVSVVNLEWTTAGTQDKQFTLEQNYPNPFNPTTTIRYKLEQPGQVRLSIFDMTGREVMRVIDQYQVGGMYSVTWNGKDEAGQPLASGVYFANLNVNGKFTTVRMTLMK